MQGIAGCDPECWSGCTKPFLTRNFKACTFLGAVSAAEGTNLWESKLPSSFFSPSALHEGCLRLVPHSASCLRPRQPACTGTRQPRSCVHAKAFHSVYFVCLGAIDGIREEFYSKAQILLIWWVRCTKLLGRVCWSWMRIKASCAFWSWFLASDFTANDRNHRSMF